MTKLIRDGHEARQAIRAGVDRLADSVRVTLGPRGRNVLFGREYGPPTITNDGVTIAKEVELEEPFEKLGALRIQRTDRLVL